MLFVKIIAGAAALYLLALIGVTAFQRSFLYFPDKRRIDPATLSAVRVNEHIITTPDGAQIVCWYTEAAPGKPTLLYFHGNGAGLINRLPRFVRLSNAGIGLFMMSYRSYSGSTGKPSEKNNIADAELAWQTLVKMGLTAKDIVLYGESLGSGVATQIAARYPPRALVLEAPYSSITDVASMRFPLLPVSWLIRDRYDSVEHIKKVHAPLLIIHGERDGIVPIRFGRKLFEIANQPKRFVSFPDAGHLVIYDQGGFDAIEDFLEAVDRGGPLNP